MKKKRIVENDKSKILQTIEELDQKKNEALNIAWQKVIGSGESVPSRLGTLKDPTEDLSFLPHSQYLLYVYSSSLPFCLCPPLGEQGLWLHLLHPATRG